ncbi:MAG: beta-lactamase family protein [Pseudomonadota bacterium]|nr:beta-lactamase family protein [Pseudomonadota bacterium]
MLKHVISLLVIAAAPAAAQPLTAQQTAAIDQAVAKALADTAVPSASITIVRDGKIVLTRAYGKANEGLPAQANHPYQIASISKQFTAMALLLLEDEGKLNLDDKVSKWVPGISGGDKIALRQLLNHTSGLQDYWPQDFSFPAMARPTSPQAIVDIWAKKPLDFAPGDQAQYSNTGYVIAGMIAEKASGEPLMSYLKRKIFVPLKMTSVVNQDDAIGAAFPSGYGRYALGPVRPVTPAARGWLYAAGELSMSAEDLAKWNIARINRSLVPADDWAAQETTAKLNDGTAIPNGLGVFVSNSSGRRAVGHGGESVGFLATNTVYPAERTAITVMTNSWSGGAYGRISREIAKIVLPQPPEAAAASATTQRARIVYDQLRTGALDRSLLTDNANYYFTEQAVADYRSSLGPLGAPTSFEPNGKPSPRGGFMIQGYTIKYPARTLNLSTFYEPASGRIEQFLVSPGE